MRAMGCLSAAAFPESLERHVRKTVERMVFRHLRDGFPFRPAGRLPFMFAELLMLVDPIVGHAALMNTLVIKRRSGILFRQTLDRMQMA